MREPYPTGEPEFNKHYTVMQFSKLSLYSMGVPVEVLRSLTEEDMETIRNFFINWYAAPANFSHVSEFIINAFLIGKGWQWEYDEEDEVFITKRPPKQTGGKENPS